MKNISNNISAHRANGDGLIKSTYNGVKDSGSKAFENIKNARMQSKANKAADDLVKSADDLNAAKKDVATLEKRLLAHKEGSPEYNCRTG